MGIFQNFQGISRQIEEIKPEAEKITENIAKTAISITKNIEEVAETKTFKQIYKYFGGKQISQEDMQKYADSLASEFQKTIDAQKSRIYELTSKNSNLESTLESTIFPWKIGAIVGLTIATGLSAYIIWKDSKDDQQVQDLELAGKNKGTAIEDLL